VSDEVETVVDVSSDKTYVAGYVSGALKSIKNTEECKGVRDIVTSVLAKYKAGEVADTAAVDMVKEAVAVQKSCV